MLTRASVNSIRSILPIQAMDLHRLDLNLLVTFHALMREASVTRAGARLGLSQPAISYALAKLRATFGDPLFVREGSRMQPTARAQALAGPIGRVIELIGSEVLTRAEFDPATAQRSFTLCMTDIGESNFAGPLAERLLAAAPGVAIRTRSFPPELLEPALADGEADLAVGFFPDLRGAQIYQQALYETGFVCIARAGHPQLAGRLTRRRFVAASHVALVSGARSQGFIERDLQAAGIERRVAVTVQYVMSLVEVLTRTDLICVAPVEAAERLRRALPIDVRPLPYPSSRFAVRQHWHGRYHGDAANQWLRGEIRAALQRRGAGAAADRNSRKNNAPFA